jgi:hypothetical protein
MGATAPARSQTSLPGSAPKRRRQSTIPKTISGTSCEKTSAPANAREWGSSQVTIHQVDAVLPGEQLLRRVLVHPHPLFAPLEGARQARRVLPTGGRDVLAVPNVAYWRSRPSWSLAPRWGRSVDRGAWRDPHVRFFTPRSMQAMLELAGFPPFAAGGLHDENLFNRVPALRRLSGGHQAG